MTLAVTFLKQLVAMYLKIVKAQTLNTFNATCAN